MALPPQLRSGGPGAEPGHGPFGDKAFKAALIGCVVLIVAGVAMLASGSDAVRGVGTAFIVLCGVCLLTAGAGLLAERLLKRTPPPPPEVRGSNGHAQRYSLPREGPRRR
jgi:hypothetical protein